MTTDEYVKKRVVEQLYWDDRIDASDIEVKVNNNKVTLEGTVPSYRAKNAAFYDSAVVDGAFEVQNNLSVIYPLVTTVADTEVKADVENAIITDTDLNSTKIDVTALDGQVTLKGTVDAYWKKILAEDISSNVIGVKDVVNELAVVPTEKISDENIAHSVINALERNYFTKADAVDVKVKDGVVKLSGDTPSSVAKEATVDSALFTPGVTYVDDDNLRVNVSA